LASFKKFFLKQVRREILRAMRWSNSGAEGLALYVRKALAEALLILVATAGIHGNDWAMKSLIPPNSQMG
jgi:hypothetical protein